MTTARRDGGPARHRTDRKLYVIGSGHDCPHPPDDLTYLGHQGTAAYYRCSRCASVLITGAAAPQPIDADAEGGRGSADLRPPP